MSSMESDAAFELRWRAWRARGVAHERAFRRKLFIAAPLLTAAIVSVLLMW